MGIIQLFGEQKTAIEMSGELIGNGLWNYVTHSRRSHFSFMVRVKGMEHLINAD